MVLTGAIDLPNHIQLDLLTDEMQNAPILVALLRSGRICQDHAIGVKFGRPVNAIWFSALETPLFDGFPVRTSSTWSLLQVNYSHPDLHAPRGGVFSRRAVESIFRREEMKNIASLIAVCGLTAAACADVTLKLKSDQDLFLLSSDNTSPFWIGNNPSACALVGDNLFVAGYANGPATTAYIVKIENIFGTRAFRQVPNSATSLPSSRGFTGLSFSARNSGATGNLLAAYDSGASSNGSIRLFDVTTQLNPILRASSTGIRGSSCPAWDPGFNAAGFAVGSNFYPEIPSALYFGAPGPLGLDPVTLDANFGATVYEPGLGGPNTATGMGGTLWRDFAVTADGAYLVGRAGNQTSVFRRTSANDVGTITIIGNYDGAFTNGQNVEIIQTTDNPPVIILNNRPTGATASFANVIKFFNMNGSAATVNLKNSDGTTDFTAPDGVGYYDFSWDNANQRLAILDFSARRCYIFEIPSGCAADYNGDTVVDFFDYLDFVADFSSNAPGADFNADTVIDFFDYLDFVAAFSEGC